MNKQKYYEWGEWPELLLYKCFWLNTDAKVHKLLGIDLKEIIDIRGHYLWEKEVFDEGKEIFKENFQEEGWFEQFSGLADKLTSEMLMLEGSDDIEKVFLQASECLSCSEIINLFDHAFMEFIDDYSINEKQDIFNSIHPKKNTHIMQLQEDIRNGKSNKYLIENYSWVGTHGFEGEPFSVDKIEDFRTKEAFVSNVSDSVLVNIGSELSFYRSYIVETVDKILFSIIPNLNKFASDKSISIKDVYYMTPDEIFTFESLPKDIEDRKKSYGVIGNFNGNNVITGDELERRFKEIISIDTEVVSELKGMIAFKGKVKGRAIVIVDKKDLANIEEGDILISNETTPEYIVAMKKATAIVTNLGGITSHAAIVAREMKKPCITGTKIATKVIDTGDIIEVDADNGVVRIIKKAK